MISTAAADPTPPPPAPPTQPPRSSFSCDRHPDEQFNGFCPECLCERLTILDQSSTANPSSSSRRPSTSSSSAAAAIKSLFTSSTSKTFGSVVAATPAPAPAANPLPPKPSKPISFFPELRRTKSFSASKHEAFGLNLAGTFEPQRKSCDVRGRNSLWSLFTQEHESNITVSNKVCTSNPNQHPGIHINDSCVNRPVFESKEEDEDDESEIREDSDEIVPVVQQASVEERDEVSLEIVQEEEEPDLSTIKPMKDHIDNDSQIKKSSGGGMYLREIAGSFLSAASGFNKKWHKWRQNQKLRKRNKWENSATLSVDKSISKNYRETQSEVADYGFGRRSCDTDPRFSLDAGRISFDDPRYSFDEPPRASWDGYLIGRSFPKIPPMVSVVEDAPVAAVARKDAYITVEEPHLDESVPGGSVQTKEYYSDSSSRRKSLDRSTSIRKTAASVVAEMNEMKAVSNAKATFPPSMDYFQGTKVFTGDRDTSSNCMTEDYSESFHLGGGFRNHASVVPNRGPKKSRRWNWKLFGFMQRRISGNKDEDEDKFNRPNGVERSYSESWQDLRRGEGGIGEVRGILNGGEVFRRSNSSVSWRHSNNVGGVGVSSGNVRRLGIDMNGYRKNRGGNECVLERKGSARYSPNNTGNGLLRFYLTTPMRNSRRGGVVTAKNRPNGSHSIARNVLPLH